MIFIDNDRLKPASRKTATRYYPLGTGGVLSSTKNVGLKDLIYYHPIVKSKVSFGAAQTGNANILGLEDDELPIFKNLRVVHSFEDSISAYCHLKPDRYQREAMARLYAGYSTVLTAPTGIGKTMVATYIMGKNLAEGKGSIYTTPLKALSNQKYKEFCRLYGKHNVGLVTGDVKINSSAPIKVMTTEIYRNMVMDANVDKRLRNIATVVHDEFHNMNDPERGPVWESSIMYTPPHIQQLWCSATIGNEDKLVKWANRINVGKVGAKEFASVHVSSNERPVPLIYSIYDDEKKQFVPLIIEKYNLSNLKQAAAPDANEPLYDIQKEVLGLISQKAGGDGDTLHGIKVLERILDEPEARADYLEENLKKSLKFSPDEAKRISLLLTDKSLRQFNNELMHFKPKKSSTKQIPVVAQRKRMIEFSRLDSLMGQKHLPLDMQESLESLGEGSVAQGFGLIKELSGGKNISIKDLRRKLDSRDIPASKIDSALAKLSNIASGIIKAKSKELEMIENLHRNSKTPVIVVNFSQRGCEQLHREVLSHTSSYLKDEEKQKVVAILQKYKKSGIFLGTKDEQRGFLSGVAVHHAGKMPGHKALVEELAQKKLLKVIISTDTIGAGINVPARSLVFAKLHKYYGGGPGKESEFVTLSSNELHQIAGRAGRRGMDTVGHVFFTPDEEHSAFDIYNMVTAPADNIRSNFKPTPDFVSNYIGMTKNIDTIEEAVDKSFLRESLNPNLVDVEQEIKTMKSKFRHVAEFITHPEVGCFRQVDGKYEQTLKGAIVAKARGVNGFMFAHIMTESPIEKLSPDEFASLACAMTPRDEKNQERSFSVPSKVSKVFWDSHKYEVKLTAVDKDFSNLFRFNYHPIQFVQKWSLTPLFASDEEWRKIVTDDMGHEPHFTEGDLFKSVNRTVDVVQQMKEIAEYIIDNPDKHQEAAAMQVKMREVGALAKRTLRALQKSPMLDHLK